MGLHSYADEALLMRPLVPHLDVQCGEVAVEVLRVVDVRLPAHRAHHVSDVFVPHGDGEVLLEAAAAHRALAGGQGLHLQSQGRSFTSVGVELNARS